jgi:hypothetical protein
MTVQEAIDKLTLVAQRYGDMPVIIYVSENLRFEIADISPCTARDHALVTLGPIDHD